MSEGVQVLDQSILSRTPIVMANTLDVVIPQLLAQGMLALRENIRMPWLVNRRYETTAGKKHSTVEVPYPSRVAVNDVAPANVPPTTQDVAPEMVAIPCDQWKEAPFYLDDKSELEVMAGTIPMQASEAVKSLANTVDTHILGMYKKFGGAAGTAGTTPFSGSPGTTGIATQTRKVLNKQLSPMDPRHVVMDPDTEAAALELRAFQDASWSGSTEALIKGRLNEKFGFSWWMSQNVLSHTAGTGGGTMSVTSNVAKYAKTVTLTCSATGTLLAGDVLYVAGVTDPIVVAADVALIIGDNAVALAMSVVTPLVATAAVTLAADHVANMAFHRDAIAFVTRPLEATGSGLGHMEVAVDEESGLAMRLEVTREHKRTRYSFDMLYGAQVIRPEFGVRLVG